MSLIINGVFTDLHNKTACFSSSKGPEDHRHSTLVFSLLSLVCRDFSESFNNITHHRLNFTLSKKLSLIICPRILSCVPFTQTHFNERLLVILVSGEMLKLLCSQLNNFPPFCCTICCHDLQTCYWY